MNPSSEAKLALVYPELARRARVADSMLLSLGFTMGISQGLRTWTEQAAEFAKGRNPDGTFIDPVHRAGVVTYAKPGRSWHNFGLALDFFFLNVDGAAIWDATFPGYIKAVEIFESLGVVCGARWPEPKTDPDHVQLTGDFPLSPDAHALYIFREGGLPAIFAEVDKALGIKGET